jgi:hypothetical protein
MAARNASDPLDHLAGFARVILLARFDLLGKKYYVRSIHLDRGNAYAVRTDDVDTFRDAAREGTLSHEQAAALIATNAEGLRRYDVLFSSAVSLIFLPVAFAAEFRHVSEVEFKTEAFARQAEEDVREAVKELGQGCRSDNAVVRGLARSAGGVPDGTQITPPDMAFQSEGYWKLLLPGEIGQD